MQAVFKTNKSQNEKWLAVLSLSWLSPSLIIIIMIIKIIIITIVIIRKGIPYLPPTQLAIYRGSITMVADIENNHLYFYSTKASICSTTCMISPGIDAQNFSSYFREGFKKRIVEFSLRIGPHPPTPLSGK